MKWNEREKKTFFQHSPLFLEKGRRENEKLQIIYIFYIFKYSKFWLKKSKANNIVYFYMRPYLLVKCCMYTCFCFLCECKNNLQWNDLWMNDFFDNECLCVAIWNMGWLRLRVNECLILIGLQVFSHITCLKMTDC